MCVCVCVCVYIYICIYTHTHSRDVQKVVSLTQKELEKQDSFSLFFNIVPLDSNV